MSLMLMFTVLWGLGILIFFTISGKLLIGIIALLFLLYGYLKLPKKVPYLVLALFLGVCWAWIDTYRHPSQIESTFRVVKDVEVSLVVRGKIDSHPIIDGDRVRFFLLTKEVRNTNQKIKIIERLWVDIRLNSAAEKAESYNLMRGDFLQLPLKVSLPSPPTNPGSFNFPKYLWQNKTYLTAKVVGFDNITTINQSSFLGWKGLVQVRQFLERRIDHIFSGETSGVMKGMLLGEQREVPIEIEEIYRNAGILHILAISGSHVMIVIGGLFLLFAALRVTRERSYEMLIFIIPIYMLLTGLSPSVCRAGIMGLIYVLARRIKKDYSAGKAISIAFIIITLFEPRQIYNIGFQLSFAVTFGLIFFTHPIAEYFKKYIPRLSEKMSTAIAFCVVAEVIAFPIIAQTFHQMPLSSLLVNLLILPLFTIIIPWGYLSLLFSIIWIPLGKWISLPLDGMLELLHHFLDYFTNRPLLVISITSQSLWWWMIYCLLFLFFVTPKRILPNRLRARFSLILILLLLIPFILARFEQTVKITFIDVGQGDSILIQGPNSCTILIDGGGVGFQYPKASWQIGRDPYEVGKDVVVPTLRALGISRLDWLILSHGDGDHIGGLKEVVRQIHVKNVLVNGLTPTSQLEKELFLLIQEKNIPIKMIKTGSWLRWNDHVSWEILSPSDSKILHTSNNNASIVLKLTAYKRTFLFTGDLEAEGEKELIERIGAFDIDFLKVAHHGSKGSTSDQLLSSIKPEIGIISVGKNNSYGHPTKEVLKRLENNHILVYRTDQHGAITFTIKKNGKVTYKSWLEK